MGNRIKFKVLEIGRLQGMLDGNGNNRMIVGTGVDLVEISRVESILRRWGDQFLGRVFTSSEVHYCEKFRNKGGRYAARFAAKEAVFKALGTGWGKGIRWRDVEITRGPEGKPNLQLGGRAAEVARELGVCRIALSLSHVNDYALAHVIFESDAPLR